MQRINVVGVSGSGKSTFAKRLAQTLSLPYLEMDRIFWCPHWQSPDDEDFFCKLRKELAGKSWVLDGNYTRTIPIKWKTVEMVVWIDLPFLTTLYQAIKRGLSRALSGEEIWPGTENRESLQQLFFSKDSMVWWTLKNYSKVKKKYEHFLSQDDLAHIKFVRLQSHEAIEEFFTALDHR